MRHQPNVRSFVVAWVGAWLWFVAGHVHANRAGTVEFAIGNVVAIDAAGTPRALIKHGEVNAGDRVHTNQGRAQIRFTDGAFVSLVPDTEFQVRAYAFQGRRDAGESSILALLKGTIRAVSGAIARSGPDRFQINTPTATLGVRGTGGIVSVLADGSTRLTATSGIWIMTNPAGTIDVPAGGSALVTPIITDPPRRTAAQTHSAPPARPQANARQQGGQAQHQGAGHREGTDTRASSSGATDPHGQGSGVAGDATRHAETQAAMGAHPSGDAAGTRGPADADARGHAAGAHAIHGSHAHMIVAVTGTSGGSATAPMPVPTAPLATATDPLLAPLPNSSATAPVTSPPQTSLPLDPAPLPPTPFDAITLIRSSTEDQQAHLANTALAIGVNNDLQNIRLVGANSSALITHATTVPGTVVMETGNYLQDLFWGRWTGTITALASGTLRNMQIAPGEGYHYIAGLPTAPNTMPTNGTLNYTLAGATNPTVFVGTGGPAIPPGLVDPASTLRIDFATGKVGIDLKVNWSAAQMGGTAMQVQITTNPSNLQASPISLINAVSGTGFQPRFVGDLTQANNGGGVLAAFGAPANSGLTCSIDCTAGVRGFVAGPAATSAGVAFKFGNSTTSSTVTGVAGFKQ